MEHSIEEKLIAYKKKYHLNQAVRGLILAFILIIIGLSLVLSLEAIWWFGSDIRTLLFFLSLFSSLAIISWLGFRHLIPFINLSRRGLDDKSAAKYIGEHFPEIQDKLLNALQLKGLNSGDHSLVMASISQKMSQLQPFNFSEAIDFRTNLKPLRILAMLLVFIVLSSLAIPNWIPASSKRLVNFNRDFTPSAPFQFVVEYSKEVFRNDDSRILLSLDGNQLPEAAYIISDGRLIKMDKKGVSQYEYEIKDIKNSFSFQLEAAGFRSEIYNIRVLDKPELADVKMHVKYPSYTGLENRTFPSMRSLIVPEGTVIDWSVSTRFTDYAEIVLRDEVLEAREARENQYVFSKIIEENNEYSIKVQNQYGINEEGMNYEVEVVADQYPSLEVEFFPDTVLFEFIIVSGSVSDDYGIKSVRTHTKTGDEVALETVFKGLQTKHSFYHRIDIDSTMFGQPLEVWLTTSDNDAVNGSKTTKSSVFKLNFPDASEISKIVDNKSKATQKELEESIQKSEKLNENLERLEERLRSKNKLEWQEEKMLNEILNQRNEIENSLKELRKQFEELNQSENKFNERSERLKEKAAKLQELMNQVLDDETKKLYEELEKLLDEKGNLQDLQDQIRNLRPSEKDMEKELERALELFKRLKLESELEKASQNLEKLGEEQENLAEQTENEDVGNDELMEQQQEIQNQYDEIQKDLEEINEMNQDLKNPEPLQDSNEEQENIQELLDQIQQELQENQRQKGSEKQRQSGQEMKKLGQKMQQMQAGMEMEMMNENIEDLRNLLDNLVKISFKQEDLIREFRKVRQVDPRFVELSQDQLKIRDDAAVLEDSLQALAERVAQISSFITRELSEMNRHIDESVEQLKDRNRSKALASQQYSMTSINNLALLLDDVLRQMQMAMAEAMGKPKKGEKGNQSLPNLKQLQQQLSQRIQDLKDSGLEGRKLSEELAKMAAEQEMLRNELQKLQKQLNDEHGEAIGNLGEALEGMEENEIDLVNKRISQELIERQEKIITRLLEAENALREQELDDEREGESATDYDDNLPEAFEEYLRARQKEIELLRTVPLDLNPFYKKEVNDYFRRISNPR